jgi:hypothetical protein
MFTISVFYTSIIGLQPPRNRKRNLINFIAGLFLILSLGLFQLPTLAQIDLAIIQEIIDGDQVFIQENQAKVEDKAEFGQVVVTKDSRAGVIFNNGASGRMDTNSQITVGQCVEIQQGKILVSGPINGCIAGFTCSQNGIPTPSIPTPPIPRLPF